MTTDHVFISYSRGDREAAAQLTATLQQAGFSVWIDEQLRGGANWTAELVEAIKSCQVLLLLISRHSVESSYVLKEAMLADRHGRAILPIMLEQVPLSGQLEFLLAPINYLEIHGLTREVIEQRVIPSLESLGLQRAPQSEAPAAAAAEPGPPQPHAVIIGVSEYRDAAIPDLRYAASDARRLADVLVTCGGYPESHVTVLIDADATLIDVKVALARLRTTRPGDLVLFYFAGHGRADVSLDQEHGADALAWRYLVTHDAQLAHLDVTSLTWDDLQSSCARIPAQRQVHLLDSCYSGTGSRSLASPGTRGVPREPDWSGLIGPQRVLVTACQAHEMAYEYEAQLRGRQHPVFHGEAQPPVPLTDGSVTAPGQAAAAETPLEQAEARFNARQYAEAVVVLEEYLPRAGERTPAAYYLLGRCQARLECPAAALRPTMQRWTAPRWALRWSRGPT